MIKRNFANYEKYMEVIKMVEKTPIESWKYGLIELAKWENESKDGKKYISYTLSKSFEVEEDGKKVWKSQKMSLSRNEADFLFCVMDKWKTHKVVHKTDFTQKPKE